MDHDRTRRRFLALVAGAPLLAACSSGGAAGPVGQVDAGNIKDLPEGSLRAVGGNPVAIGRDAGGVYAVSLACTHQGCNIAVDGQVKADGIACGCHGSRFDANGAVMHGPASSPLPHFAVSIDGAGEITIHGETTVPASTRAPA